MSDHGSSLVLTSLLKTLSHCKPTTGLTRRSAIWKHTSTRLPLQRRTYTSDTERSPAYKVLDPSIQYEEERLPGYIAEHYCAVNIGDIFYDRYQVIGKLGFGTTSTVWMCLDLTKQSKYVAIKVYVNRAPVPRELSIQNHIDKIQSELDGQHCIRRLLDTFEIDGPDGSHTCLVHQALGMNMEELREKMPNETFNPDLARQVLRGVVPGMSFLHSEAHVVHTDIQPKNILLSVLDDAAFERFEREELETPMPRKELPSRTICVSRPMPLTKGSAVLCDLGEARLDHPENDDLIMPSLYRAPEVVLGMPWSYPVDVWAFGMTLWDLFQPKRLFSPYDKDHRYSEHLHLAQMVAIMGNPPLDFLQRSRNSEVFWNAKGEWIGDVPIPRLDLEAMEQRLQGEEKRHFLIFMRKMLHWRPEDRSSLEDVFMDEWLLADRIESGEVVRD